MAVECITDRFDQRGYAVFRNLEDLVLKTCKGELAEEELKSVCGFYGADIDKGQLQCQIPLLKELTRPSIEDGSEELSISYVAQILRGLAQRVAFSQVFVVMNLLLVLPATNATSERSFSALRRVKNISTLNYVTEEIK